MKTFIEQARLYAADHPKFALNYTHLVGIPLIFFSLMILLGFVKIIIPDILFTNLAFLSTLGLLIYYFRLKWQLALVLTPFLLILLSIASFFSAYGPTPLGVIVFLLTFLVGWGLQAYGHFHEGKKNALTLDLQFALIAPLYLIAELLFLAGLMHHLKDEIQQINLGTVV